MSARGRPVRNVVIFGATSAIAEQTARLWVVRGASLVLVGRNVEKLEAVAADLRVRAGADGASRIFAKPADLDDLARHGELISEAQAMLGTIDGVLIAHGTLPDQAACAGDVRETIAAVHTNAISVISLCTLLANVLERQGYGRLAVISSVAGDRGRQSNYVYGASKGMVSLFSAGVAQPVVSAGHCRRDHQAGSGRYADDGGNGAEGSALGQSRTRRTRDRPRGGQGRRCGLSAMGVVRDHGRDQGDSGTGLQADEALTFRGIESRGTQPYKCNGINGLARRRSPERGRRFVFGPALAFDGACRGLPECNCEWTHNHSGTWHLALLSLPPRILRLVGR